MQMNGKMWNNEIIAYHVFQQINIILGLGAIT